MENQMTIYFSKAKIIFNSNDQRSQIHDRSGHNEVAIVDLLSSYS